MYITLSQDVRPLCSRSILALTRSPRANASVRRNVNEKEERSIPLLRNGHCGLLPMFPSPET
eukprot:5258883-Pyramimonas_sp.AAC.2